MGTVTGQFLLEEEAMTQLGYMMMCEQAPPKQLLNDLARAEALGFDFSVISDHYSPWLEEQGHSPYTWAVLGAATQITERIPLMTFVTCPIMRYHPAVVAQKAATVGILSGGRFTLGLGAGENLNEHVVGQGWPAADVRQAMFAEAVQIIDRLFAGGLVSYRGKYLSAYRARLYDRPEIRVPIAIAASGRLSIEVAARHGDGLVAVDPDPDLVARYEEKAGPGKAKYGQLTVCYGHDARESAEYAARKWAWAVPGWKVLAELPDPAGFEAYNGLVRPEEIIERVPCGPDPAPYAEAVRRYRDAGFTHVAMVQIGCERQDAFLDFAEKELLPALREG
jgi:G6PDH family F420-dependent oxidoreductase